MIKRYFTDYHAFHCIADKCPSTCCSGWAIEIDDASLNKYGDYCDGHCAKLPPAARDILLEKSVREDFSDRIDWQEEVFTQQPNGDCAFLRPDGLCHMQATYGEDFLCQTCARYPRHMEEFPGVEEYSLSVSCPEVARMLLACRGTLSYTEVTEPDSCLPEGYEDFNMPLYTLLLQCRQTLLPFLTDRNYSYAFRGNGILYCMENIQKALDDGRVVSCEELLAEYLTSGASTPDSQNSSPALCSRSGSPALCSQVLFPGHNVLELLELFTELEPLRPEFRTYLEKCITFYRNQIKLSPDGKNLSDLETAFRRMHPDTERYLEHISVYFIFTYMCGAVYDDYVYAMSAQAVYNSLFILLLWMFLWHSDLQQQRPLTKDELSWILYSYSRELEHSTENMILLEQLLDQL